MTDIVDKLALKDRGRNNRIESTKTLNHYFVGGCDAESILRLGPLKIVFQQPQLFSAFKVYSIAILGVAAA